jgi:DNA-binding NtrC family response regulator
VITSGPFQPLFTWKDDCTMSFQASVLVVDDDPATLIALPDMLMSRLQDVTVTTCESALTGLEALHDTKYRVLIADLRMPEMDGLTLLRKVRHIRQYMPVLIMSGVTEWGLAKRVIEAGAFAFIQKPVERAQVAQSVRLAIQCSRMLEQVRFGKRRLARLSELLKRAHGLPCLSHHMRDAVTRMEQGQQRGTVAVAHIERVISRVTEALGKQSETLRSLQEDARTQAKIMLQALGE